MKQMDLLSPDLNVVRSCVEGGIDVNSFVGGDANDVRALAVHCFSGRVEIVKFLLANGAKPDSGRDSTGETPLHHAVLDDEATQTEIVDCLVAAGADPNMVCNTGVLSINFMRDVRVRGETPLHRAAAYGNENMIQALLDAGASKELKDFNGDSPLSWASLHNRDIEILRMLCYGDINV